MAEWTVQVTHHAEAGAGIVAEYQPHELNFSIKNSDVGDLSFELPIAQPSLLNPSGTYMGRDTIIPYQHDFYLYRGSNLRMSGMFTSVNLNKDRDTVLVGGKDWIHYLDLRRYPFDPRAYVEQRDWELWPKQWGLPPPGAGVDLQVMVEDILDAMINATIADYDTPSNVIYAVDHTPPFLLTNPATGILWWYKILPADQTTILQHIKTLSEVEVGFEFDILPSNLEFKMYSPDRDGGYPIYSFTKEDQITDLDWTNEGPLATITLIYGAGSSLKRGVVRTFEPSVDAFRWTENVADVGSVFNQEMLNSMAASERYADRFPRKKLSFTVHDPELLTPNFWTGGRPRSLIGNRIRMTHNFQFHTVDAYFRIMALNFKVDQNGNEEVEFEVEMINDPAGTGTGVYGPGI
jgi:hypothetical protein